MTNHLPRSRFLRDLLNPSGAFLLHIPSWFHFYLANFSDTSRGGFLFIWVVSLTHPVLASFLISWDSLTHPMLASFLTSGDSLTQALLLSWEYLLHIPCWLYFAVGSFSYTYPSYLLFFNMGVSVTHNNNNNLFYIAPQQQLYELLALYTSTNAIEHTSICYLN